MTVGESIAVMIVDGEEKEVEVGWTVGEKVGEWELPTIPPGGRL